MEHIMIIIIMLVNTVFFYFSSNAWKHTPASISPVYVLRGESVTVYCVWWGLSARPSLSPSLSQALVWWVESYIDPHDPDLLWRNV